jgi:hypothetical protein
LLDFLGGELVLVGGVVGDAEEGKEDKGEFLKDIVKYAISFHSLVMKYQYHTHLINLDIWCC